MKKREVMGRKELVSIYNDFIDNVITSYMLVSITSSANCSSVSVTMPNGKYYLNTTDFLRDSITLNFGYKAYNQYICTFIKKCIKKDKTGDMSFLDVRDAIEYIKSFAVDYRYSKEFDVLFDDYFNIRKCPCIKEQMQLAKNKHFNQCMLLNQMDYIKLECLTGSFQPIQNIPKNSKPLIPLFNSSQIGSSNNKIPLPSYALTLLTIAAFCVVSIFLCKFANK
ncbi:hypothetical protein [Candidatus Mesenet endosymbiont of Agriotes lineatus]|uniref:hypothetical protein n=1 Tax=Candidatus Mesenet endosymbiont of Agriotes lineatus TaxID=3077948 RepID=UPI0030CCE933